MTPEQFVSIVTELHRIGASIQSFEITFGISMLALIIVQSIRR